MIDFLSAREKHRLLWFLRQKFTLEPCKDIFVPRVLECANAGNVPLWTVYCLHSPSVNGGLPSLVADLHKVEEKPKRLCDCVSRHLSWLRDDEVFLVLSSLHHV